MRPFPIDTMRSYDFILLIIFPLTPFFWKGSTRDEKQRFSSTTDSSLTETSFNGTVDEGDAAPVGGDETCGWSM